MALKRVMFAAFIVFLSSAATIWVLGRGEPSAASFSPAEVARHSSQKDCWMAISGDVYALSAYIPSHPAPPETLTAWCGKDATEAFNTKGVGRPHSSAAREALAVYRIGALRR